MTGMEYSTRSSRNGTKFTKMVVKGPWSPSQDAHHIEPNIKLELE